MQDHQKGYRHLQHYGLGRPWLARVDWDPRLREVRITAPLWASKVIGTIDGAFWDENLHQWVCPPSDDEPEPWREAVRALCSGGLVVTLYSPGVTARQRAEIRRGALQMMRSQARGRRPSPGVSVRAA